MSRKLEPIGELDLLAYADGLLEADVVRKVAVERHLKEHPEVAARVAEIQAQNEEIRGLYGSKLVEPVPDRLLAVLQDEPSRDGGRALKAAAVAGLLLLSATAGWLIGQHDDDSALTGFVEHAATHHRDAMGTVQQASGAGDTALPFSWPARRIALEIEAPDLQAEGFSLVTKERVGTDRGSAVHLVYQRPDGAELNLFLRPRWEERTGEIRRTEVDGVTVRYWLDGPLAFALTTDARGAEADRLAGAVHQAVKRARLNDRSPPTTLSQDLGSSMPGGLEGGGLQLQAVPARPASQSTPQQMQAN